jgi:hypothetical protein
LTSVPKVPVTPSAAWRMVYCLATSVPAAKLAFTVAPQRVAVRLTLVRS